MVAMTTVMAIIAVVSILKPAAAHHEKEKMTNVPSFLKLFMPATSYLLLENGSINLIFMQTSTFPDHLIRCQQWFVKIVLIWSNSKDIFKTSSLSYYSHIPPLYGLLLTSPTLKCLPHILILNTFWMKSQYTKQIATKHMVYIR